MSNLLKEKILERIQLIFRDHFMDDKLRISENTSPEDIIEWDSLAHIGLIAAIETEFSVRFTAEEISRIGSVTDILDVIVSREKK